MKTSGITVQCVDSSCKKQKTLAFTDAVGLDGPPLCECGCVMVTVEANIRSRRGKGDIRDVVGKLTRR